MRLYDTSRGNGCLSSLSRSSPASSTRVEEASVTSLFLESLDPLKPTHYSLRISRATFPAFYTLIALVPFPGNITLIRGFLPSIICHSIYVQLHIKASLFDSRIGYLLNWIHSSNCEADEFLCYYTTFQKCLKYFLLCDI